MEGAKLQRRRTARVHRLTFSPSALIISVYPRIMLWHCVFSWCPGGYRCGYQRAATVTLGQGFIVAGVARIWDDFDRQERDVVIWRLRAQGWSRRRSADDRRLPLSPRAVRVVLAGAVPDGCDDDDDYRPLSMNGRPTLRTRATGQHNVG
jgi:hypothetical protein